MHTSDCQCRRTTGWLSARLSLAAWAVLGWNVRIRRASGVSPVDDGGRSGQHRSVVDGGVQARLILGDRVSLDTTFREYYISRVAATAMDAMQHCRHRTKPLAPSASAILCSEMPVSVPSTGAAPRKKNDPRDMIQRKRRGLHIPSRSAEHNIARHRLTIRGHAHRTAGARRSTAMLGRGVRARPRRQGTYRRHFRGGRCR